MATIISFTAACSDVVRTASAAAIASIIASMAGTISSPSALKRDKAVDF